MHLFDRKLSLGAAPGGECYSRDFSTSEFRIEARHVTKSFKHESCSITALEDVCLDVLEGEFLAIVGSSGAGKTTFVNILAGVEKTTGGSVTVFGRNPSMLPENEIGGWRSRTIGYIPQKRVLVSAMSVLQNVELPLQLTRLTKAKRHDTAMEALDLFRMAGHANLYPRDLTASELLKVVAARAISSYPRLLLCDQIGGNSDSETTMELLEVLHELNEHRGTTIIITTCNYSVSESALTARLLERGRLVPICPRARLGIARLLNR